MKSQLWCLAVYLFLILSFFTAPITINLATGEPLDLDPSVAGMKNADEAASVFINFLAVEQRTDLTEAEKEAIKKKVKEEILVNFNQGKDRIKIVDDPLKADRAVLIQKKSSPSGKYFGLHTGSSNVEVYLETFMDYSDARLPDSFKTGGKWDSDKLGKALGTIAAHELAHSYSAGHKKNKTDGNKMNPTFWTELATKDYKLDATALAVIDDNLNKKSCKPEHIKDYAGVVVHWEEDIYPIPVDDAGLPLGLYSEPNTVELTFDYTIDTPYTGETFKFGWLGADSDMGMQDGSSEFDFITKAFLDSSFDSLITVFDGWAFNPALFYSGGTAGPAVILTLDWSEMHLSDYVLNWEGIHVARFIELIWDFDGIEGTDVTVRLNSKAYGGSNTTNGVTPIPEPSSILLFLFGLCGFSAVFKNPKRATN